MEMLDRFILNILGKIDDAVARVENSAIKLVEWCWHSRVNILHKKRRKKNEKINTRRAKS